MLWICSARGLRWLVEQPEGSILQMHPRFQEFLVYNPVPWLSLKYVDVNPGLKQPQKRFEMNDYLAILFIWYPSGVYHELLDGCFSRKNCEAASPLVQLRKVFGWDLQVWRETSKDGSSFSSRGATCKKISRCKWRSKMCGHQKNVEGITATWQRFGILFCSKF